MTKIVRDYITDKIKEGTQAKLDELNKKVDAENRNIARDDVDKLVKGLPEFKALQKAIGKSMKDKFGVEVTKVDVPCSYYWIEWDRPELRKARNEFEKFIASRDRAIRDALVELELSKSKADVDGIITEAIAALTAK